MGAVRLEGRDMNRRCVLAGAGFVFGTSLGGCLEDAGGALPHAHCRGPDDDAETIEYDEIQIVGNERWLATEYPLTEPHLVLVRSQETADEWIQYDHLDQEARSFLEGLTYGDSSLLVAEASVTAGYRLAVHGVEWLETETVFAYLCEEDHREDDQDYPAVDTLRSRVLGLYHGEDQVPTSAEGSYVHTPSDPRELPISEFGTPHRERE